MKPFAYSYTAATKLDACSPWDYDATLAYGPPGPSLIKAGMAHDVTPLYSRAQVAKVRERAATEYKKQFDRANRAERRVSELEQAVKFHQVKSWETGVLFGAYGDTLRPFLALMVKELEANSHKGDREGWLRMDAFDAEQEVLHHVRKLESARDMDDTSGVVEHAADVANCCMMLLDVMGLLTESRPEPSPAIDFNKEVTLMPPTDPAWAKLLHVNFDGAEGKGRVWLSDSSDDMVAVEGPENCRKLAKLLNAWADAYTGPL